MITTELATMIRAARKDLGLTQEAFGKQVNKSRQWVAQLEGANFEGRPFAVTPDDLVKIALILRLSPVAVLKASGIHQAEWPDLSYMRSKDANIRAIDITTLNDDQAKIIEQLVETFKTGNRNDNGNPR